MIDKDSGTGEKTATPTLSDEEIKLAILDSVSKSSSLVALDDDELYQLKILFQWVKGE